LLPLLLLVQGPDLVWPLEDLVCIPSTLLLLLLHLVLFLPCTLQPSAPHIHSLQASTHAANASDLVFLPCTLQPSAPHIHSLQASTHVAYASNLALAETADSMPAGSICWQDL
jgi:hypothetical protein